VLIRPLYQEVILPNLCYIGGGGEIAYWLQLKAYFESVNITFPMLLLRNSVLIQSEKQYKKQNALKISDKSLFLNETELVNEKIKDVSKIDIDFSNQKKHLKDQFKALYDIAKHTDKTFLGAVSAQERKQIKGLEYLEKRLLKAQKKAFKDYTKRVIDLKQELFPHHTLQERYYNFSEFFLAYGHDVIPSLVKHITPLESRFILLKG